MDASPAEPLYLTIGKTNPAAEAFRALRREAASASGADASKTDATSVTSLGFGDLLDALNPLQHLPVVSTLYRNLTGDEMGPLARMAGGLAYGGPIGFAVSLGESILEEATGDDLGGHIMTALFGGGQAEGPMVADAGSAGPAASAAATAQSANPAAMEAPTTEARGTEARGTEPGTTEAQAAGAVPHATPQLSPATFDALIASFPGTATARALTDARTLTQTPDRQAAAASDPKPGVTATEPASGAREPKTPPPDILGALGRSLDKYQAMTGETLALDTAARLKL